MGIQTVACVGGGIIGSSWACVFARQVKRVWVYEPIRDALDQSRAQIEHALQIVNAYGLLNSVEVILQRIAFTTDLEEAVAAASYVQENVPENLTLKSKLFQTLDQLAPSDAILASSTSGFPPSAFSSELRGRDRCLVVHPLNPPHLIPAVEVCPAPYTSVTVTTRTIDFLERVGQKPALIRGEVTGFVMNRLQLAVLREALSLVERGICAVNDLDLLVKHGLGLRWATMGPFETNYLSTTQGYGHFLVAYGETLTSIMKDLAPDYVGSEVLGQQIDAELMRRFGDISYATVADKRDKNLARILEAGITT